MFAYVDELSAASVSGYADELAITGRARQRYLDLLTSQLLNGEDGETLRASADTAAWPLPETLTAVLVPAAQMSRAATFLNPYTLQAAEDLPGLNPAEPWAVLLVPDAEIGDDPSCSPRWRDAQRSSGPAALAVRSDFVSAGDPRTASRREGRGREGRGRRHRRTPGGVGASCRPGRRRGPAAQGVGTAVRIQPEFGRSAGPDTAELAAAPGPPRRCRRGLDRAPQTVRYRMNQIRQVYGDRLDNPEVIFELTVALGITS